MIKQGNIEMKKALFVFYLLFFTFNIYSISYYISNSIGQKISPTNASGVYRNNYVLRVDDNYEQLYNKGELVKSYTYETIEPTNQNNVTEKTVTIYDYKTSVKTEYIYHDELLVKCITEEKGVKTEENLVYSDSSLIYISKSVDGNIQTITYFLRSAYDGSLIGVRTYSDSLVLLGEGYLYEEDNLFRDAGDDFILQGDFEVTDSGEIKYTRNNVTYTFMPSGKILKAEYTDSVTEYFYDSNEILLYTVETIGNVIKTSFYSKDNQNSPESESTSINGIISEEIIYDKEGMIKIIYSNGNKIGTVYYEPDNLRVKNVVYERTAIRR